MGFYKDTSIPIHSIQGPPEPPRPHTFLRKWIDRARNFKKSLTAADIKRGVVFVVTIQSVFHVLLTYGVNFTWCIGPSMMPTISGEMPGELVFINCFPYKVANQAYKRGDVVISEAPNDTDKLVCKRVAATEGDEVVVMSKNMHHRVSAWQRRPAPILVPPGHVWLAGDNCNNSTDSRTYGPVPVGLLQGKVCYKAWRLEKVESKPWPHDAILVKRAHEGKDEEKRERLVADALLLAQDQQVRRERLAQAHAQPAATTATEAGARAETEAEAGVEAEEGGGAKGKGE